MKLTSNNFNYTTPLVFDVKSQGNIYRRYTMSRLKCFRLFYHEIVFGFGVLLLWGGFFFQFAILIKDTIVLIYTLLSFQSYPDFKIDNIADKLNTGVAGSVEKEAHLWNYCSEKFVQITRLGSKGVNARGSQKSPFCKYNWS